MVWSITNPDARSASERDGDGVAMSPRRWIVPALIMGLVLWQILEWMPERISWETEVVQGIGVEALRGSTEGRQALVGSSAYGLLPSMLAVGFVKLFEHFPVAWPRAALLIGALAMGAALRLFAAGMFARMPVRRAFLPLVALVALPSFLDLAGSAATAVGTLCALGVLLCLIDWFATGRSRSLVTGAIAMALAVLCPVDTVPWVVTLAVFIPLHALPRAAHRRRLPATLLLWMLPMGYAIGVWLLLNWLILGNPFFFVQGLAFRFVPVSAASFVAEASPFERFAVVIGVAGLAVGAWRRDARTLVPGMAAVAAAGWIWAWQAMGHPWAVSGLRWLLSVSALLSLAGMYALALPVMPAAARIMNLAPLAAATLTLYVVAGRGAATRTAEHRTDLNRLERFVLRESPYGRVFVCGFDALGLLWHRKDTRLQPVLDLYPNALFRDYRGQALYLLVPNPRGRTSLDAVFAAHPGIYAHGVERALMIGDWEVWRLFQLVSAEVPSAVIGD